MATSELEALTGPGSELMRRAAGCGVRVIWRAQVRDVQRVEVRAGKTEAMSRSTSSGHGVQVFTEEGRTAFASRDDFEETEALRLLDRAKRAAEDAVTIGAQRTDIPDLPRTVGRAVPPTVDAFARVDLRSVANRLAEIEAELATHAERVTLHLSYASDLDAWRVRRSDGTDVLFAMPRCVLRVGATTAAGRSHHSVGVSVSGPDPMLPWDEKLVGKLLQRAERAVRLAHELPDAPAHASGSYPIVMDYALAKGLAHEAFGHAAEADGFRSSVLASNGRFRVGEPVGPSHLRIVDEPLQGDHAWQPFSANGLRRDRAVIVDHGRLADALSDPWSAHRSGVRLIDAGRAESFRHVPLPRMTNIRIELDDPFPAPGEFEEYGPEEVRDLLESAGLFRRHAKIAFLSGYGGGQVNTATGDFVFNCKSIYALSRDRIVLHRPAIFAGSMFGALLSVREAFGPLRLDAIGTCGKWGQSVPSSGGSHYFVVLDPHPTVRLGGE